MHVYQLNEKNENKTKGYGMSESEFFNGSKGLEEGQEFRTKGEILAARACTGW
jgi:hypothetical protein